MMPKMAAIRGQRSGGIATSRVFGLSRPCVRPVSTVSYKPMDGIHQTLVDDVVEGIY